MKQFSLALVRYRTKKGMLIRAILKDGQTVMASKRGFKLIRDAKRWAATKEDEILGTPSQCLQPSEVTFSILCKNFLDYKKQRVSKGTHSNLTTIIKRFKNYLSRTLTTGAKTHPAEISSVTIERYMMWLSKQPNCSPKTANRHLRDLSAIFNHAITRGIEMNGERKKVLMVNPCKGIEKLKEKQYIRDVPSNEVVALYRKFAEPGFERDFIDTLCLTLQRGVMVRRLAWKDIDWNNHRIIFWHSKGRGDFKAVPVKMTQQLEKIMMRRFNSRDKEDKYVFTQSNGRRYHRNSHDYKYLFSRIKERIEVALGDNTPADLPLITAHGLRHWGSHALDRVIPRQEIQKQLGHGDLRTTQIYLDGMAVSEQAAENLAALASALKTNEGD